MKTFVKRLFVLIVVLILFAVGGSYLVLKNSLPEESGEIRVAKISNDIEITFDKMGLPQIWAESRRDAFFAMGWQHAADRLFQMDLTRRVSYGRLSEIFGDVTLEMDKLSRQVGHYRMARDQMSRLSARNRVLLEAYSAGVNAWVRQSAAMPFEFYILQYDFDEWKPVDCLTILSFQTWFSDALQNNDLFFVSLFDKLGPEEAHKLYTGYPEWAPYTVPEKKGTAAAPDIRQRMARRFLAGGLNPFVMSTSSNSWVVAPSKSASGAAMLASDPHLELARLPQFWYYAGMHAQKDSLNVMGITTPGLPLVVMGYNGKAAWAFTVGGVDVTEYYREQVNPQDSLQYAVDDGWENFGFFPEEITVAGRDQPVNFTVKTTRHGPLVMGPDSNHIAYAFDWAGFDVDLNKTFSAAVDLMQVDNFEDFRPLVTNFGALDANWMYADVKGNIGYQLGSPIAIRPADYDNAPIDGRTVEDLWQGYYPLDQTPHSYNPPRGWLATANNKHQSPLEGVDIPGNYFANRIMRISDLLGQDKKFSAADFKVMQQDRIDASLIHFRDIVKEALRKNLEKTFGDEVLAWKGDTGLDSRPAAFLNLLQQELKTRIFKDELGKIYKKVRIIWVEQLLASNSGAWYDDVTTEKVESRDDILAAAIVAAENKTQNKTWGDFQSFTMAHPLSVVPLLSGWLDLKKGPMPWPGTEGTINVSFSLFADDAFNAVVGPSWRFVVDFSKPLEGEMVIPAGNSGNPMGEHFMDFYEMWKNGEYWPVSLDKQTTYGRAAQVLKLQPAK